MYDYTKEIRKQLDEVERLLVIAGRREKTLAGLPEGKVRVSTSNKCPQYFFREKGTSDSVYMPSKNNELIKNLLQREYDRTVLKRLEDMRVGMNSLLKHYSPGTLDDLYDRLCEGRKKHVKPIELTDKMYEEKWLEEHPGEKNPFPDQGKYETDRGEFVRSKSEKILADMFNKIKIPYRYETQLRLDENKFIYPDFVCLNVKKRKTIYWEHLGMVGVADYAAKNLTKLEMYEKNGLLLGDNLIVSIETPDSTLDIAAVKRKIELFLK